MGAGFECRFIHQGDMAFDHPVVERIIAAGRKIPEERTKVNDSANEEPESGNNPQNSRHHKAGDEKIGAPPFERPW